MRRHPALAYEDTHDVMLGGASRAPRIVSRSTGRALKLRRDGRALLHGSDGSRQWVPLADILSQDVGGRWAHGVRRDRLLTARKRARRGVVRELRFDAETEDEPTVGGGVSDSDSSGRADEQHRAWVSPSDGPFRPALARRRRSYKRRRAQGRTLVSSAAASVAAAVLLGTAALALVASLRLTSHPPLWMTTLSSLGLGGGGGGALGDVSLRRAIQDACRLALPDAVCDRAVAAARPASEAAAAWATAAAAAVQRWWR